MTNKEFVIKNLSEMSDSLDRIIDMLKKDEIPQNEDWIQVAVPLRVSTNILMNYEKYKNEEYKSDFF